LLLPLLLLLTWRLQQTIPQFNLTLANLGLILATIIIIVILHEIIHGLAYQLFGYRVTYGASLHLMAAYAAAFGQWQKRGHNLIVALAPLLLLTLLLLPLLALPQPTITLIALTGLLFNTAGAVGDLYLVWKLLSWPKTTRLYDVDLHTMLVFLPDH